MNKISLWACIFLALISCLCSVGATNIKSYNGNIIGYKCITIYQNGSEENDTYVCNYNLTSDIIDIDYVKNDGDKISALKFVKDDGDI